MAAREFARVGTDMPDEPSIKALNVEPQWLYDRLLLRKEMSRCGVVPYRPAVWAELAPNATEAKVKKWVRDLEKRRQVIVDERYGEALVRTYVRHDGLLSQPNVVANMCSDFRLIESDRIRIAFLAEFRRIWDLDLPETWRGGWLLAVGLFPDRKMGKDDTRQWPAALPAASIDRLRKAVKDTGILGPLRDAIIAGQVDSFTAVSPEGLPEPILDAAPNPTAKPSPKASADPSRNPSANPSPNPHTRVRANSGPGPGPGPGPYSGPDSDSEVVAEVDHQDQPDVTRERSIGLGQRSFTDEPPF